MRHPKTEIFSDYMDGDLSPGQAREVERHMEECPRCASLYRDLLEVRERARSLPDQYPERDLWPDIANALREGHAGEAEVIRLHPSLPEPRSERRRLSFRMSYIQAAAAALVLAFSSASAGAFFASSRPGASPKTDPTQVEWVALAGQSNPELTGLAEEITTLEARLTRHRSELDPETVRLLEKNLGIIDQAIQESMRALEADPGNAFLENHLTRTVESKVTYLREAAAFIAPAG